MMSMFNRSDKSDWKPLIFENLSISTPSQTDEQISIETIDDSEPESNSMETKSTEKITQEVLEQLKQETITQAYQEGFNAGKTEGFDEGKQAGYKQGYLLGQQEGREHIEQQLNDEKIKTVQAMCELINNFQQSINDIDELIVPKLFDLALAAAQKTVGTISKVKQKQLMHTLNTFIEQRPIFSQPISLHLNPTDLQWLEPIFNDEKKQYHWELVADPNIEIGGCKIFSDNNEIDASTTHHWQMMADCLHKDTH
jgi:flagellar assembly protein FliH